MENKAYVWFVNAHAKGYGGANYVDLLHQEFVLIVGARLGIEASMIWHGTQSVDAEHFGQLLGLFATEAIDNGTLAWVVL